MFDNDSRLLEEALSKVYIKESLNSSPEINKIPIGTKVISWGFGATGKPCHIVAYKQGGYIVQPIDSPASSCFQPYENIELDYTPTPEASQRMQDRHSEYMDTRWGKGEDDY